MKRTYELSFARDLFVKAQHISEQYKYMGLFDTESILKTMHWAEDEKNLMIALSQLDQDIEEAKCIIEEERNNR